MHVTHLARLDLDMQASSFATPPAPSPRRWTPQRVIAATVTVLLVAAGFYLLYQFSNVLFVLFVAAVLATAMRPAVLWLERYHIPQWLGILIMFTLIGLLTAGVIAAMAPILVTQGTQLFESLPQYYTGALDALRSINNPLIRSLVNQLPQQLNFATPATAPATDPAAAVSEGVTIVRAVGWSLFGVVATALITYFWILDREQIVRAGLLLVPLERRGAARELWDTLEEKVGAFIRGQALLCLSIGVLTGIAFFLIGVPNTLLLAVLAGIFEAIPYLGPILTALLAVVVTLAQSPEKIWWVLGACLVIQQVENALLVPRIMDRAVGINAVVTLLAIAAFGTLLGIGGAIMAIPLAVVIQVLFDRFVESVQNAPPAEIVGRDQVAVLRYYAQDLSQDIRDRIREREAEGSEDLPEEDLEAVVGEIDQLLQTLNVASANGPEVTSA